MIVYKKFVLLRNYITITSKFNTMKTKLFVQHCWNYLKLTGMMRILLNDQVDINPKYNYDYNIQKYMKLKNVLNYAYDKTLDIICYL